MVTRREGATGSSATAELVDFVLGLDFETCPDAAIETAEQSILDTIGVVLGGVDSSCSQIGVAYVDDVAADGPSHVPGRGGTYPPEFAAFLTGVQGHALDFDDVTYTFPIHPSVTIVPTLLALGEATGSNGRDLIATYVAAFEFEIRVAGGVGSDLLAGRLHPTAVVGVFGSLAAAARLLDLDRDEFRRAIGIVASLYGGSTANFGTMTKPLHAGRANENGIRAAKLAKRGFTGNGAVLEGPTGPWPACFDGYHIGEWADDLGERWYASDGIGIKRYPSCGCTHAAIDAASTIADDLGGVTPDDVEAIEVRSVPAAVEQLRYDVPRTPLEGKFSMHYCVASALTDGTVTLSHFTEEAVDRPEISQLSHLVDFEVDEDLGDGSYVGGSMPSRVTVTTADEERTATVTEPSGTPGNPIPRTELDRKFRACAERALTEEQTEEALRRLDGLRDCEDASEIAEVISR